MLARWRGNEQVAVVRGFGAVYKTSFAQCLDQAFGLHSFKLLSSSGGRDSKLYGEETLTSVSVTIVRALVFVVFLAGLVTGVARLGVNHQTHQTSLALILASGVMIAFLALLEAAQLGGRLRPFGWTSVILGADGRISTSKSSVWLWTMGLGYALLFLAGIQIFTRSKNVFDPTNWNDYLILIGGPFAAAVLAKFAVVNQLASGVLAKSALPGAANPSAIGGQASPGTKSGLASIVANDSGGLDLVDSQYFLFNIVAFAYAAGVFIF